MLPISQTVRQEKLSKEVKFKIMVNVFEELYNRKLEPSTVELWRKFLYEYPENYFVRVVELAGECKFMPTVQAVKERMDEYYVQDSQRSNTLKITGGNRQGRKDGERWLRQIFTILNWQWKLKDDFKYDLFGRLYVKADLDTKELEELLDRHSDKSVRKDMQFVRTYLRGTAQDEKEQPDPDQEWDYNTI